MQIKTHHHINKTTHQQHHVPLISYLSQRHLLSNRAAAVHRDRAATVHRDCRYRRSRLASHCATSALALASALKCMKKSHDCRFSLESRLRHCQLGLGHPTIFRSQTHRNFHVSPSSQKLCYFFSHDLFAHIFI